MTRVQVRTEPAQQDVGADILLDWFTDRPASTVQFDSSFLKNLSPSPVALDLLRVAGAVFCTDKVVPRAETSDYWTRDIDMHVPVGDTRLWEDAKPILLKALAFLSGDRWSMEFVSHEAETALAAPVASEHDAVSLFSGGLDSLAGVIDLLEAGKRLVLVGHHDSSLTDNKQVELFAALQDQYGQNRLSLRRLLLRPAARNPAQHRPLPAGEGENTTRSRSFLFLAAGLAIADAVGDQMPLFMPENGFIGINVPLTPARAGSLSTRTTHPLFMTYMRELLDGLGLANSIENPYRLATKGEALQQSRNKKLLSTLAARSVSCSHPEAARWAERPQGNCGYCYPCLIRRAAMHRFGEGTTTYAWDALSDSSLLARGSKRGRSLRALAASLGRPEQTHDVLRNGRIPNGETEAFFQVYSRGRNELREWLTSGAGPELSRRLRAS